MLTTRPGEAFLSSRFPSLIVALVIFQTSSDARCKLGLCVYASHSTFTSFHELYSLSCMAISLVTSVLGDEEHRSQKKELRERERVRIKT